MLKKDKYSRRLDASNISSENATDLKSLSSAAHFDAICSASGRKGESSSDIDISSAVALSSISAIIESPLVVFFSLYISYHRYFREIRSEVWAELFLRA